HPAHRGADRGGAVAGLLAAGDRDGPLHPLQLVRLRQADPAHRKRAAGVQDLRARVGRQGGHGQAGRGQAGGPGPMKLNFEVFFPALRPWVMNLVNVWPAYIVKPQYANWEVLHILSLTLLGGTAILMNLRLLNVGIVEEPPSEVYRNLRRWQDVGVIGIIISGILIGMANAEKLYD